MENEIKVGDNQPKKSNGKKIAIISIVAVMVHGLVDTVYFRPQIQYLFWTMAAILTVLVRKDKVTE